MGSTIRIGGSTHFFATIYNPGISNLSGLLLQGSITQGSVLAPAGGVVPTCQSSGVMAPGACNVTFTVNPKSSDGLVAGGAQRHRSGPQIAADHAHWPVMPNVDPVGDAAARSRPAASMLGAAGFSHPARTRTLAALRRAG